MFLCTLGSHQWSAWQATGYAYDDGRQISSCTSTIMTRRCAKCGIFRQKTLNGMILPLDVETSIHQHREVYS